VALSKTVWEIGLKHLDALVNSHLVEETLDVRPAEQAVGVMHDESPTREN
jgi:hypothetical protein